MAKAIKLTQGYWAVVDDEDYERINAFRWFVLKASRGRVYGYRTSPGPRKGRKSIYLHREVLGLVSGGVVDHHDGDCLNNQKSNLRVTDKARNGANSRKHLDAVTSSFKGVCRGQRGLWRVQVGTDLSITLRSEIDAAQAYNLLAFLKYGEFCKLNEVSR